MISYIVSRLGQSLIVLIIVSFFTFSLIYLIPGDPVITMLGPEASIEEYNHLKEMLGLDLPFHQQYGNWFFKILHGDFGKSIIYGEDIIDLIATRLPVTLHLGITSLIFSIIIAIPAGVIAAVRRGSILDQVITVSANIGMATPIFWLGILGIYLFSLQLDWLPVQGYTSPFEDFWHSTRQIIMPVLCMSVVSLASLSRQTRSSMLEVIRQDYIRTALSKGLEERVVITKHALKNAIIPVITLLGLQIRFLFTGSVLVETVFNIPGLGRLLVRGVFDHDYIIVQSGVLMVAAVVALANLITDISYGYFDPRIRYD
ncbi:ABC transporter permease [Thermodesulfobacteriota bacterium]